MDRFELARRLGVEGAVAREPRGATIVEERDPARFMAAFAAAVGGGGDVFLADPNWGVTERAELARLVAERREKGYGTENGWLMIPSGGTSGRLKFARHDEETIVAAVRGFCEHFRMERVNAMGVLPLHHVSGLMSWMRCALTGGEYRAEEWKRIEAGVFPARDAGRAWVLSLVPTQLQRLLAMPAAVTWLRKFAVIFVGGGPAWASLVESSAEVGLPLSLSYGMTETAAMVTALRPGEFAAGARSSGAVLPHARVRLEADGRIVIGGASLFRGYYPGRLMEPEFATEDLGRFDDQGQLHVLGRRDAVIITGGEKVHPAEVEAALRASGEFSDVAVLGMPDAQWGEQVVAVYPAGAGSPDVDRAVVALTPWQRPKRFVAVDAWPRNEQGKLNRAALRAQVNAPEG